MAANHDIFQGGHIRKESNILKSSCNAGLGYAMDSGWLIRSAPNLKTAAIGRIEARDDIEKCRLAGAVRANQSVDLPSLDR
jgi:hypothetical protein